MGRHQRPLVCFIGKTFQYFINYRLSRIKLVVK